MVKNVKCKKLLSYILIAVMLVILLPSMGLASEVEFGNSDSQKLVMDGVDENGLWHIGSEETLRAFARKLKAGELSLNAVMEADISMTASFSPMAMGDYYYKGTFDGNGHAIYNLEIARTTERTGFFSTLDPSGVIKNLTIYGKVTGSNVVGGIVGYCKGTVENCVNYCEVTGDYRAGGITAYNNGGATVHNCRNYGTITSPDYVGGITAYNKLGTVKDCINEGVIVGERYAGGIVGRNTVDGVVINCEDRMPQETVDYDETTSIFAWNYYLLNEGSYPDARVFLKSLRVDRVYQEFSKRYLKLQEVADMVARLNRDGIEVVALTGDRNWGLKSCDLSSVKAFIDAVAAYNSGIGAQAKITKVGLDIESYITAEWKADPQTAFADYVVQMKRIYDYAHGKGLGVVQIIPVHFDKLNSELFRTFVETCCDELSLMNYTKSSQISGISGEVAVCKELNKPVETIFETMANSETHGVSEENSYFYDGFDAIYKRTAEIFKAYNYEKLSVSYHHFPTVYHVYTGNYMAEIYGYTDSKDPNVDELGQTDAIPYIVLHGNDGSVIKAGLYNPNRSAEYPETCYLAMGVKPGVTYTITVDQPNYQVRTTSKQFDLQDSRLVDYTSISFKYVPETETSSEVGTTAAPETETSSEVETTVAPETEVSTEEETSAAPETETSTEEETTVAPETETSTEAETTEVPETEPATEAESVPETVANSVYETVSGFSNGLGYVIACDNYILTSDCTGVSTSITSVSGGFDLGCEITSDMLWTYNSGKIFCSMNGKTYYLATNGKSGIKTVTSASKANSWSYENQNLYTGSGKKASYLSVSKGSFILGSTKGIVKLYREK